MNSPVLLRVVLESDLPIFFAHQRDPVAARMAAFLPREHGAFMAHWRKLLADPTNLTRTIVSDERVVGNVGSWNDAEDRLIGYWVGREVWGQGIATAAVAQFLECDPTRPLRARVAKHNLGSIRVLQKCGFEISGEEHLPGEVPEVLMVRHRD